MLVMVFERAAVGPPAVFVDEVAFDEPEPIFSDVPAALPAFIEAELPESIVPIAPAEFSAPIAVVDEGVAAVMAPIEAELESVEFIVPASALPTVAFGSAVPDGVASVVAVASVVGVASVAGVASVVSVVSVVEVDAPLSTVVVVVLLVVWELPLFSK